MKVWNTQPLIWACLFSWKLLNKTNYSTLSGSSVPSKWIKNKVFSFCSSLFFPKLDCGPSVFSFPEVQIWCDTEAYSASINLKIWKTGENLKSLQNWHVKITKFPWKPFDGMPGKSCLCSTMVNANMWSLNAAETLTGPSLFARRT